MDNSTSRNTSFQTQAEHSVEGTEGTIKSHKDGGLSTRPGGLPFLLISFPVCVVSTAAHQLLRLRGCSASRGGDAVGTALQNEAGLHSRSSPHA